MRNAYIVCVVVVWGGGVGGGGGGAPRHGAIDSNQPIDQPIIDQIDQSI